MTEDEFREQLRVRLAGLSGSGVGWLPHVDSPRPMPTFQTQAVEAITSSQPVALATNPLDARRKELTVLAERVTHCTRCPELASTRTQTVFGVGPVGADILFVGEAPGADEDRQGEPFVGAAGQLLNKIIVASGLKREEVYICNILRCRPPGNRTPKPDECANCREYLEQTIAIVQPKLICCWGGVAAKNLLGTTTGITKLRGKFYSFRDTPVLCTFHPSALLRDPTKKKDVWEDMHTLMNKIGRPIQDKGG